jgi:hypothetical protein
VLSSIALNLNPHCPQQTRSGEFFRDSLTQIMQSKGVLRLGWLPEVQRRHWREGTRKRSWRSMSCEISWLKNLWTARLLRRNLGFCWKPLFGRLASFTGASCHWMPREGTRLGNAGSVASQDDLYCVYMSFQCRNGAHQGTTARSKATVE